MAAISERQMRDVRHRVLGLLKLKGSLSAGEMSQDLEITYMGVRQHLTLLERDGLIRHHTEQRGRGRPTYVYSLTESGHERFPRTYPQLANDLLDTIRALDGEDGIERVFGKRTEWLEARYKARLVDKRLEDQVRELAQIRTEEGYMAGWEKLDGNSFVLWEHNCAIRQVARHCAQACSHELELFRRVLDSAEVTSEAHMMAGDRACAYRIRPKS
jgi:predicted ArsR family transcriptional regulator